MPFDPKLIPRAAFLLQFAEQLTAANVPDAGMEAIRHVSDNPGIELVMTADAAAREWIAGQTTKPRLY